MRWWSSWTSLQDWDLKNTYRYIVMDNEGSKVNGWMIAGIVWPGDATQDCYLKQPWVSVSMDGFGTWMHLNEFWDPIWSMAVTSLNPFERFNILFYPLPACVPNHGQWYFLTLGLNPAIANKTEISIWTKSRARIYAWVRIPKAKNDKGRKASQPDAGLTWWWLVAVELAVALQQPVADVGR